MPYQDWYTTATNAASNQGLPPALVPPTGSFIAPQRQPLVPINAEPVGEVQNTNQNQQPSTFAGSSLRTAGRFEKSNAFVNPMDINRAITGGASNDIVTERRTIPQRVKSSIETNIMSQEQMMPYDYQTESRVGDPMESLYSSTYKL
jgi:hypothetical protein